MSRLEDSVNSLASLYLGKFGIVAVGDISLIINGKGNEAIVIHALNPDKIRNLLPSSFNGYRIVIRKSGNIIPL